MRSIHRPSLICFLLFFAVILCSGCSRKEEQPGVLENLSAPAVFKAIEAEVPEDFGLLPYVEPWADANGNVTALTAKYSEEETSEGITWHTEWFLTDFSPNGEILNSAEIPVQMEQVFTGAVTDTAVYLAESMTGCTRIVRYDRETKELTSTGDGSDFFGRGDYALQALSTDENGFLYCTDTESLIVLNPDLSEGCDMYPVFWTIFMDKIIIP